MPAGQGGKANLCGPVTAYLMPLFLLSHHHLRELLVVDLAIAVNIGLTNELIHLLVSDHFTEVGHDVPQLCSRDEAVAILVEQLERLENLVLGVCVLPYVEYQGQFLQK
jgi:hypothetical protein